jgi:hypothetical protein
MRWRPIPWLSNAEMKKRQAGRPAFSCAAGSYLLFGVLWEVVEPERTEWRRVVWCCIRIVSEIEVMTKIPASQAVERVSRLAAERGPKAVWEPWPPKAAARSALLPCCSRMMMMSNRQTMTWIVVTKMITVFSGTSRRAGRFWRKDFLVRKRGLEPLCLSAPPPQDGVSANFTTSARKCP